MSKFENPMFWLVVETFLTGANFINTISLFRDGMWLGWVVLPVVLATGYLAWSNYLKLEWRVKKY